MKWTHSQSSRGFTLVELLIGATLSAAIMAAVLSSYIYLARGLARLANQQALETEARRTLAYFTQDVASASSITAPSGTSVLLTIPGQSGDLTVNYYYNNSGDTSFTVAPGHVVFFPVNTLTRCVYSSDGSNFTSSTVLRNIVVGGGFAIEYFDSAGNPYSDFSAYVAGIKQMSLSFTTQMGNAAAGTLTPRLTMSSSRVVLRNRALLQ